MTMIKQYEICISLNNGTYKTNYIYTNSYAVVESILDKAIEKQLDITIKEINK